MLRRPLLNPLTVAHPEINDAVRIEHQHLSVQRTGGDVCMSHDASAALIPDGDGVRGVLRPNYKNLADAGQYRRDHRRQHRCDIGRGGSRHLQRP